MREFFVIFVTLARVGLDRHAPVSIGDEPLGAPPVARNFLFLG
jgi:hypothetical protein